jgi:hypothetical protein
VERGSLVGESGVVHADTVHSSVYGVKGFVA